MYNSSVTKKKRKRRPVHKRKVSKKRIRQITICLIVLAMIVIPLSVWLIIRSYHEREETPVEGTLVKNDYDWSRLKQDGSFMSYKDDNYTSLQGIDVSDHQKWINWKKVRDAGIDFVFIRCGYRGYTTGDIRRDSYFTYNITEAKKQGLQIGVYFFSQAVTVDEAREEAEYTINQIRDYDIDLPVVFDMEEAGQGSGRVDSLSKEVWTQNAVTFCHIIRNAGYTPMVYNSTNLFEKLYNINYLQEFDTWVAEYDADYPSYPYTFSIWQYSSTGTVDGIEGGTDMDIMFVKKD